ncbi:MAG TPA: sirohydrochlorin chelatase [Chroococcidiopsis sp.]
MRTFSTAYLLVSHGSRDPRSQHSAQALAALIAERLLAADHVGGAIAADQITSNRITPEQTAAELSVSTVSSKAAIAPAPQPLLPQPLLIETAVLELGEYPLHHQIERFAHRAITQGYEQIKILPLFLLAGVHVMVDLPAEVAIARQQIGDRLPIQLQPHLGSHPDLITLLLRRVGQCSMVHAAKAATVGTVATAATIIMSHGSQRPGANQPVEAIARHLGGIPAYWSMPPSLEAQVTTLIDSGQKAIAIVPYFLFAGGITDAIATRVQSLAQQFPDAQLRQVEPLGATPELAEIAVKLLSL